MSRPVVELLDRRLIWDHLVLLGSFRVASRFVWPLLLLGNHPAGVILGTTAKTYRRPVRKSIQIAGFTACLASGIVLATALVGNVQAAGTTATETTTEPTTVQTTVVTTATVEQTTTRQIVLPPPTTTSSSTSSSETPAWVWVLLGILAVALVIVIVLLANRGGGGSKEGSAIPPAEKRQRLDGAVASWTTQGWALESQTADSAVLQRAGERMVVNIDAAGHVSTQPHSA
jgi:hypothetical protein